MLCVSGDLLLSTEELDQKLVSSLVTTVGKYCPPTPTHDAHKYVSVFVYYKSTASQKQRVREYSFISPDIDDLTLYYLQIQSRNTVYQYSFFAHNKQG